MIKITKILRYDRIEFSLATNFERNQFVSLDNTFNNVLGFGDSWYFVYDCKNRNTKRMNINVTMWRLCN